MSMGPGGMAKFTPKGLSICEVTLEGRRVAVEADEWRCSVARSGGTKSGWRAETEKRREWLYISTYTTRHSTLVEQR